MNEPDGLSPLHSAKWTWVLQTSAAIRAGLDLRAFVVENNPEEPIRDWYMEQLTRAEAVLGEPERDAIAIVNSWDGQLPVPVAVLESLEALGAHLATAEPMVAMFTLPEGDRRSVTLAQHYTAPSFGSEG